MLAAKAFLGDRDYSRATPSMNALLRERRIRYASAAAFLAASIALCTHFSAFNAASTASAASLLAAVACFVACGIQLHRGERVAEPMFPRNAPLLLGLVEALPEARRLVAEASAHGRDITDEEFMHLANLHRQMEELRQSAMVRERAAQISAASAQAGIALAANQASRDEIKALAHPNEACDSMR
jgi:hypothetical protein